MSRNRFTNSINEWLDKSSFDERVRSYASDVNLIGEGASARVYSCIHHGCAMAMKVVHIKLPYNSNASDEIELGFAMKKAMNEINIMMRVAHNTSSPYLMPILDAAVYPINKAEEYGLDVVIWMPLAVSLSDIDAQINLRQSDVIAIGADIAAALIELHSVGIIHRDIKPENIFYFKSENVFALGDYGISKILPKSGRTRTKITTQCITAPEVKKGKRYDSSSDIYSLSMTLYLLLNGRAPFDEGDDEPLRLSGKRIPMPRSQTGERLHPALVDLIMRGLSFTPSKRPSAVEFYESLINISI